jgi:SAM-dependent methyltransferase
VKPFADHFSRIAAAYASHRPRYPAALFAWLASVAPDRGRAWDCGTGNGQAAVALAEHFEAVVATDPSTEQLAQAPRDPRVAYVAATAAAAPLATRSAALVTVAQALHWFDREPFYAEARRVLAPAGVIAVWSYALCTLGDVALDAALRHFHDETVGPFWPAERAIVNAGYAKLEFPFEEVHAPRFAMEARWTLDDLAAYVGTWSAVQRARAMTGRDPLPGLVAVLGAGWGAAGSTRLVEWPLSVRAGSARAPAR